MTLRVLLLLCALAASAAADDDDEDEGIPPFQRHGIGLGVHGHSGRLDGVDESAWGPNLELALGDGRFQYFAEAAYLFADLGRGDVEINGRAIRGGAGIRWLARSFELGRGGSIDMHLEGFGGVSRVKFDGLSRIVRPDFGVGVGYLVRGFWKAKRKSQIALKIGARLYFAPTNRDVATTVCRGTCQMSAGLDNGGMMVVFGGEL